MFVHDMILQDDGRYTFDVTLDNGVRQLIKDCAFCCSGEFTTAKQANYLCVYFETMNGNE
jgi:hypothetical protein